MTALSHHLIAYLAILALIAITAITWLVIVSLRLRRQWLEVARKWGEVCEVLDRINARLGVHEKGADK